VVAALSLVLILSLSFFFVRVASVALKLTGLPEEDARFQALSALTGTGFTTMDAELIVNYPIRRKIISWLMILGNLGVVSIVSTTLISFVHVGADFRDILAQLAWIIISLVIFFSVMLNPVVDRVLCRFLGILLNKFTFLGGRYYRRILQLGNNISIGEHQFFDEDAISPAKLQESLDRLDVLAVHRSAGDTEVFDLNMRPINRGDKVFLLGHDEAHDHFASLSATRHDQI